MRRPKGETRSSQRADSGTQDQVTEDQRVRRVHLKGLIAAPKIRSLQTLFLRALVGTIVIALRVYSARQKMKERSELGFLLLFLNIYTKMHPEDRASTHTYARTHAHTHTHTHTYTHTHAHTHTHTHTHTQHIHTHTHTHTQTRTLDYFQCTHCVKYFRLTSEALRLLLTPFMISFPGRTPHWNRPKPPLHPHPPLAHSPILAL